MLTKYKLIHVPDGGVDHLLNGIRIRIDYQLTNEQADHFKALGLPYFEEIDPPLNILTNGTNISPESPESGPAGPAKRKPGNPGPRNAKGQFVKSAS